MFRDCVNASEFIAMVTHYFRVITLYGCGTWSLKLKGNRLRVFEYKVLRRVFRSTRENITGDWTKLHIESFIIYTQMIK
jgi:hypothetical protein